MSHLLCSSPTVSDLLCVAPPVVCLLKCCDGNVGITWNQIRFDMKQFRTMNNNGITVQVCVFDWWGTGCFKAITPRPVLSTCCMLKQLVQIGSIVFGFATIQCCDRGWNVGWRHRAIYCIDARNAHHSSEYYDYQ